MTERAVPLRASPPAVLVATDRLVAQGPRWFSTCDRYMVERQGGAWWACDVRTGRLVAVAGTLAWAARLIGLPDPEEGAP